VVGLLDGAYDAWKRQHAGSFAQACVLGQLMRTRQVVLDAPFVGASRAPICSLEEQRDPAVTLRLRDV
jgi:hypothetical protein